MAFRASGLLRSILARDVEQLFMASSRLNMGNARKFSSRTENEGSSQKQKSKLGLAATAAAVAVAMYLEAESTAYASEENCVQPPHYPWDHMGWWASYDARSIRRGHQVFKNVCQTCHGLNRVAYRNLIGVAYTEAEAKEMASEVDYDDEPNDQGEIGTRPGKLSDYLKGPYKNENHARFANGGALPPDLSIMVKARPRNADYLFALLTGYRDPPAGIQLREGLYYNPYFPGGAIGMAKQLFDGGIEYEDGTPATASQMAKDVCVFLSWAAEPEHDQRKLMGLKWLCTLAIGIIGAGYFKRFRWSVQKTRKLVFTL